MKNENAAAGHLTRRNLLGQAVGAAGLLSALEPAGPADAQALPEGARRAGRVRESFDFAWKFLKGDVPGAQQPEFADANWRALDLPHDWSIEGAFSENAPAKGEGAYLPGGIGWYRKRFRMAESDRDRKVAIEFDGAYQNSEVWINGQYLGKRPYGFIGFGYDLTPHLNFGARDNLIAVKVDNSRQPNCRWYTGSGIYRHTWLVVTNRLYVPTWGAFITTPLVARDASLAQVKTKVRNEGKGVARCTLATRVLDRDGNVVAGVESAQDVSANDEYEFVQQVRVEKPNLWSPDSPYLYKVRSTVRDPGGIVDEYETPMGIREAVFDADKGFLLNGKPVKLNGVCLHSEGGAVGAAVPERVWERRLEVLQAMGCNSIRTSHNPYAPEFLDLCDKMGFLVMDEVFDEWKEPKPQTPNYGYRIYFDEWSEQDVTSFVHRDRNHPSVVLWSAGNEVVDQLVPAGAGTVRRLVGIFHREDPTRFVTVGCDRIVAEPVAVSQEFLEQLDVVGYNYVDRWRDRAEKYYSIDRQAFPHRRVIGTESPAMSSTRGDYRYLFPEIKLAAGHWGNDRGIDKEQLWRFVRTYDYVSGDHMWSGIDYLGEAAWPTKGSTSGVIDTCGFEKDGYYFYQSQWTTKTVLHLFPHWNWKGKEGDFIPVLCYTNCDSVELFVNGKSAGTQSYNFPRAGQGGPQQRNRVRRTTGDLHLSWTVPYQPGTLKAVGTRDGNTVATVEVATTGEPSAIGFSVDRETIAADRRDVAHIKVSILDAQGRVVPDAGNEVAFELQGEGRIIGLDSGDPASHEDYRGARRKAFNGLCLAIVQSTAKAGEIRLNASAAGLKAANVVVTTKG
jgi:beta-galactosidase